MWNRKEAAQEGYRKDGMKDRWDARRRDAGKEVCRKGRVQERRDARRRDGGKEGYRTEIFHHI